MINFYEHMKTKQQKNFLEELHWTILWNFLQSRLRVKNLPETVPQELLVGSLISNGTVGVGELKGELWCGPGGYYGDVKGYLPELYQFNVTNVGQVAGKVHKDVVVGWNNASRTPNMELLLYSSVLAEIDVSEKLNVLFARHLRIPKVHDQKEKMAIESAVQALYNGKVDAVISDNVHDAREFLTDGLNKPDMFLELSDVKDIDKLQYLNQYRDNIVKRFCQLHGISTQVTGKLAQQSQDEIHANDNFSMVLSDDFFFRFENFLDEVNKVFGQNWDYERAPAFEDNYNEVVDNAEEEPEGSDGDGEPQGDTAVQGE